MLEVFLVSESLREKSSVRLETPTQEPRLIVSPKPKAPSQTHIYISVQYLYIQFNGNYNFHHVSWWFFFVRFSLFNFQEIFRELRRNCFHVKNSAKQTKASKTSGPKCPELSFRSQMLGFYALIFKSISAMKHLEKKVLKQRLAPKEIKQQALDLQPTLGLSSLRSLHQDASTTKYWTFMDKLSIM